jgi:hypothetical protein
MKLDYLADRSPDFPLIRLCEFTPTEAGQFLLFVAGLASGIYQQVEVDRLQFVKAVGGLQTGAGLPFVGSGNSLFRRTDRVRVRIHGKHMG